MRIFDRGLLLSLALTCAFGQYYVISTVAGNGQLRFTGEGAAATNAALVSPRNATVDAAGTIYFSDSYFHQVFAVTPGGTVTVFAGTGRQGFSGDGGPATAAQLDGPAALAVDAAGNVLIADAGNSRIRAVARGGTISTVAGNGGNGVAGNGGPATLAAIGAPSGLAVDSAGNVYITQSGNHVIRRVGADGVINAFAGTGTAGYSGDGGAATAAMFFSPQGLKADAAGNVFVADSLNNRVRKISPQGIVSTLAGNGTARFSGDGGVAAEASLSLPTDVAVGAGGLIYIADALNARIRTVTAAGIINTIAGGGASWVNGPALQATLPAPNSLALDDAGRLIVVVPFARQVRRVLAPTITTVAGTAPTSSTGDNGQATAAPLLSPYGVAVDAAGNVYISDQFDNRIRKVSPAGVITTAAGNGLYGWTGDGSPATTAQLGSPRGMSMDAAGNLFVVSGAMSGVRRIAGGTGAIGTVAGSGPAGFGGDGGVATEARMNVPLGVVADAAGNLFIADTNNNRVRRVDAQTKNISTYAGTGVAGFSGDNGPAAQAQLFQPRQLALDPGGNLLIADTGNSRIRRVTTGGIISTVAGTGTGGASGDGGPATRAQISATGVAADGAGNIFIIGPARVRKVDGATGVISTIAGTGALNFSGDGGLATSATIDGAINATVDASGTVYFTDERNSRVRKLSPAQIVPEGVANAGTLRAGPVAPGQLISIFGFNIGPPSAAGLTLDGAGKVATQLGGTQVFFDGVAAPLVYVSNGQVNAIVPYAVAGAASTQMQVVYQGKATNTITLPVAPSSPGLFAVTNADGGVNSPANPAAPGSILVLYGTGEGQTTPAGVDGAVAATVFPKPILPVTVQIGGQAAEILYAGAAPGFVAGVLQLNIRIPEGVRGTVPLQLRIGEAATPTGLNVTVR